MILRLISPLTCLTVFFLLFSGTYGCTVVYNVPLKKVAYPSHEQFNLNVKVVINEELKKAHWSYKTQGDTYVLPLGGVLAMNAQEAVRAAFKQVSVVENDEPNNSNCDAVLLPKVIDIVRTRPPWLGDDRTTSVILEWKMVDSVGNLIWVASITGNGTGPFGNPLKKDSGIEQVERLLDDLFHQSFEAMITAPEIIEFAASRHKV